MYDLPSILLFFSMIATLFAVTSCTIKLKDFNCPNSFLSFPSLNWAAIPHMEIAKRCIPENDLFGQYDYNIQFIDSFRFCVSLILLYNYQWHPFFFFLLLLYLHFRIFFIANDWHSRQMKKILVARCDDHIWQINE